MRLDILIIADRDKGCFTALQFIVDDTDLAILLKIYLCFRLNLEIHHTKKSDGLVSAVLIY